MPAPRSPRAQPHLPIVPQPASSAGADEPVILPDCWYAIAEAATLRSDRPLALERLGQRLVVWRDADGRAAAVPAACPHRGADLGLGRVRAGELECPYHGFRFAGSGECTAIPCEGREARIPPSLRARALPVREAHGLIWLWHGPGSRGFEPIGEPAWIAGAPEPGPRTATWAESWAVSFTRVMEGMQDLHHFPFAHRRVDPWRGRATRLELLALEREGERIHQHAVLRADRPDAPARAEFELTTEFPGLVHLRFGPRVDGTVLCCPIDDARTWVWACYRVRTGLGALTDRLAAWLGLWAEFKLVQPDDQRMLASSWPQRASVDDHALVRADAAIAAWHKLRRARLRGPADAPGQAVGDDAPAEPASRAAG